MKTSRREFILSASAAGLGANSALPALLGQQGNSSPAAGSRRKMIVRADDIGMSDVCNIGTFEAIKHGVVTAAAVMLADPGTEDALERLKAYPWISIDWHMHMWGAPVVDAGRIPSLVEKDGPFAGRFRTDLGQAQDVDFDQAVMELRAQLLRCDKILGRVPDTGSAGNDKSPWGKAVHRVTEEFGMAYNFSANEPFPESYLKHIRDAKAAGENWAKYYSAESNPASKADPRWESRKIYGLAGPSAFVDLLTDSVSGVEKNYDPVLFYTQDRSGILKTPSDWITWQAWHPGYVDYYTYRLGERVNRARAQQFVLGRVQDSAAMVDQRLKNWIKENKIELVTFRDALYGTSEYQNHLKAVGSDLCMI